MSEKGILLEKPHLNIGTIGHVDHGKTTLASSITLVLSETEGYSAKYKSYSEIDKAPEEKKRGVTITASHTFFETKRATYSLIDCPGHADYIKNMITGASQMDGAILVVSSSDGSMPQTKEHLLLARQIGIEKIVVFINDKTGIDEETKGLLTEDVKIQLESYGYDKNKTPIITASALKALNGNIEEKKKILKLVESFDAHIPIPERHDDKPFLMYIEDVFSIEGQGTVVTGKVVQGKLKQGKSLVLQGFNKIKKTVVKGIQMFHRDLIEARPGHDVGINLRGINVDEVKKGQALTEEGYMKSYKKFKAKAYILNEKEGGRGTSFGSGYQPQFYMYTVNIPVEISVEEGLIKGDDGSGYVEPGSDIIFKGELKKDFAMRKNDRFILREGGKTVGQGFIMETLE